MTCPDLWHWLIGHGVPKSERDRKLFCRFRVPKLGVHGSGNWKNMQGVMGRCDIALFRHSKTQQDTGTAALPYQSA